MGDLVYLSNYRTLVSMGCIAKKKAAKEKEAEERKRHNAKVLRESGIK